MSKWIILWKNVMTNCSERKMLLEWFDTKGGGKRRRTDRKHLQKRRADAFHTSLFLMLHTADGHTATVQKWKCWNIPIKGLIQPYVMCVSVILCVPCQWKKNYVTFHLVRWLYFLGKWKHLSTREITEKRKEILQKGQSTHHPRIVIQQNTEVSDAPVEHHAVDPRVGHVTTCQ